LSRVPQTPEEMAQFAVNALEEHEAYRQDELGEQPAIKGMKVEDNAAQVEMMDGSTFVLTVEKQ
jgi:hypothetical protein